MASEHEEGRTDTGPGGGAETVRGLSGRLGQPLLIAATFAAGAGAALGTKALLDSRRKGGSQEQDTDEDLPTVLRRAGLDVAIAATNEAAERLGQDRSEPQNDGSALQRS